MDRKWSFCFRRWYICVCCLRSRSIDRRRHRIERWTLRIPYIDLNYCHYLHIWIYLFFKPTIKPLISTDEEVSYESLSLLPFCQTKIKLATNVRSPVSYTAPSAIDQTVSNLEFKSEVHSDKMCNKRLHVLNFTICDGNDWVWWGFGIRRLCQKTGFWREGRPPPRWWPLRISSERVASSARHGETGTRDRAGGHLFGESTT